MVIRNNLERSFGPSVSAAGVIIFIAGIFSSFYSFFGFLLICSGAFFAFTSNATFIDYEKKRIKNADCIFGFICLGKWISVSCEMQMSVEKYNKGYSTLSQSNKLASYYVEDYRIYLYTDFEYKIPIQKFKTLELAESKLNYFKNALNLS